MQKRFKMTKNKIVLLVGCLSAILLVLLGFYDYYSIQTAKAKTGKAVNEEYPILIAAKSLHSSGEDSIAAVYGYFLNNGSETYKEQYQQQVALTESYLNIVKKHHPSNELILLLQKHVIYLEYLESEVLAVYDSGDKVLAQQRLEKSNAVFNDIQIGYEKLITSKEHSIKKIEREVVLTDTISKVVLGFMSHFLVVSSAAMIFFIFRKNRPASHVYDYRGNRSS